MSLPIQRYVPSAYDIFKRKPVSDVCEQGLVEYFYPKNGLKTEVLEFVVEGNLEQIIVPSKIFLKLQVELSGMKKKAAASDPTKTVANGQAVAGVVNNILHSLFESVEVLVSNEPITKTDRNYPYNAMLQTLCNHGQDALDTYFVLSGWAKDTAGHMDDMADPNEGFTERRKYFKGTQAKAELIGKIYSPLFFQEKVLPPQVSLKVILRKASEQFYLKHEEGDFTLNITEAVLMVPKVRAVPAILESYIELLEEDNPAPYFLSMPIINPISIESGCSHFIRDNIFLGKLPRRVVIAMVDTMAFHGKRDKNPFNFQHFGITEICLYKDGTPYPRPLLKMDFEKEEYAEAYHNFITSLNGAYTRNVPSITMEEFANGYTLFSFDMSPDQMGSVHPASLLNMNSNVRLEMKFKQPLTSNITLLLYSEFDHLMEIHRNRRVTLSS